MSLSLKKEKDLYGLGEMPPLGVVPKQMHAFAIRQSRYGEPKQSLQREIVDTPRIGPDEVLVYVMATGINYNNVWAALGYPVDVIAERQKSLKQVEEFHVGGSDCSGIVWAVGKDVENVRPGDEVVVHSGWWPSDDSWVASGQDPMLADTARVWGYQTNYGSFGQFSVAKGYQCLPRPKHLTWEASGCYLLCACTAYRMLMGWAPHTVAEGDVVLVWGAAGGLGSMAVQICRVKGARPVAVISGEGKRDFCLGLGAVGVIDRTKFDHWGQLPDTDDIAAYDKWLTGARAFGKAIWDAAGSRISPRIVFEHPAESTLPTSNFVCATGGMVVICAGTTGYNATLDVRYHWMRQKRFQGSHVCNTEQASEVNDLVRAGKIDPCLSRTFSFDEIGAAHQLMRENKHPFGNMACLVNATAPGQGAAA